MSIDILTSEELELLTRLIDESQSIVITCHQSPDGDAIGSSLAWAAYLWSLGKEATVIVPDQYPDFLSWLPNTEKIVRYDKHREKCDMLLKIADNGTAVLMATHNYGLIQKYPGRILKCENHQVICSRVE